MPKILNIPNSPEESFGMDQNYGRQYYNKPNYLSIKRGVNGNANDNYARHANNRSQYQ
jgi:hypothetical protein